MRGFVYVLATMAVSGMLIMGCEPAEPDDEAEDFETAIAPVWEAYQDTATALSDDDAEAARDEAERLRGALADADNAAALSEAVDEMIEAEDIEGMREAFEPVSIETRDLLAQADDDQLGPIYVLNCPMAFDDEGADWLHDTDEVANPYFGETMFQCGDVAEILLED